MEGPEEKVDDGVSGQKCCYFSKALDENVAIQRSVSPKTSVS